MIYLRNMHEGKYLLIGDGSSPHMLKWVRELVKSYDVFLISSRGVHPGILELLPSDRLFLLETESNPSGGNSALLFKIPKVFSIIRKINPTVVNAHYITSHGLLAAIVRQFSVRKFFLVQSAWGTDVLVTPFTSKFNNLASRYSLNQAQLVTSDSEYMTSVVKSLTDTPVLTFTFGLDELPDFDPGLKQHGLFFSNRILSENYNIEEVLRFFSRIAAESEEARLVVANDGNLRPSLEKLAKDLKIDDRVQFLGFIPQAEQAGLFIKSEYFISIPASDSTSVSLLEAMAHGCIPVVSDIPANKEWVTDGENGIHYSRELNFTALEKFRRKKNIAIEMNRKLIAEKAIFPHSMVHYLNYLKEQIQVQG